MLLRVMPWLAKFTVCMCSWIWDELVCMWFDKFVLWLPELIQFICVHSVLHRFAATHFNVCSQWRCLLKVNHRRPCSFYGVGTVGAAVGPHWMSCVCLCHSIACWAPTIMGRIEQCVFVARFFDLSLFAPAFLEQQCVQRDCVFLPYIVFCGLQRCVHSDRDHLCTLWNYGFNWFVCASGFGTRLFTQHIWQVCIVVAGAGPIVFWSHSLAQSCSQSFRCLFILALLEQQCVRSDCVVLHFVVFCRLQRYVHSDMASSLEFMDLWFE